jgi:imidazolonepropionase-like amidohydrolase
MTRTSRGFRGCGGAVRGSAVSPPTRCAHSPIRICERIRPRIPFKDRIESTDRHETTRQLKRFLLILALLPVAAKTRAQQPRRNYEITNASWFQDSVFVRRTVYVARGRFSERRPSGVLERIDMGGRFIVPPYADAHTHAFGDSSVIFASNASYLRGGVFYAMNLMNSVSTRRAIAGKLRQLAGVDVVLASAGLTGVRGHPILSEEMAANHWPWDSLSTYWPSLLKAHTAEGDSYIVLDRPEDLSRQWHTVLSGKPDIIKIFLLDTDHSASLRADTTQLDANGLDPALVPAVVAAAHQSGRRVAAHIETAADFHVAVTAGVDIIAHLPGLAIRTDTDSIRAVMSNADAELAHRRGITIVATAWLATQNRISRGDTAQIARTMRVERENLRTLLRAGVRIAIGSDGFADTATEARFLASLGVFSNATVLRLWTHDTPRLVFPSRKIGRIATGFDASFLALSCDPLTTFTCTDSITFRMRRGRPVGDLR